MLVIYLLLLNDYKFCDEVTSSDLKQLENNKSSEIKNQQFKHKQIKILIINKRG